MSHQHPQESWLVSGLGMAVSFMVLIGFLGLMIYWWQAVLVIVGIAALVVVGAIVAGKIMDDDIWDD